MSKHSFDMHFILATPNEDPETHLGRLLEEECDDAAIGIGRRGHIGLMFTREAPSAPEAVLSAISDVRRAIPGAKLVEVGPDLVGLTDAARILGFSRQNMRQLVHSCETSMPVAAHGGSRTLWHFADLLRWLREQKGYPVESDLIDLAETNRQVNLFIAAASELPAMQEEIRAVLV